jgi:hypothetical protein
MTGIRSSFNAFLTETGVTASVPAKADGLEERT